MGVVNLAIRRRLRAPGLSALGLEDVYNTFGIADMSTVPMSGAASPQDNSTISTLRVTYRGPQGEWRIVQDYLEKSVLSGFSAAGGLGSFFSGLCALLFGTSLFSVLFREFSFALQRGIFAFGILHGLENQQEELGRVCKSKYPKFESELRALETKENRGVLAFLLDTLLDLDLMKEEFERTQPSAPGKNMEGRRSCDYDGEQDTLLKGRAAPAVLPNAERDLEKET
ncbi:hypothetical protein EST38_g12053 [Candolleomyces aberdarensis]|uniref:Uncharacterized protein n=1 Tax=Candolleomyces aberdarensis TaxID=2316362 RepID=A0A4Q2D5M1_9AGAR|nr:hypothetical protein EST38_g12053 [Candolleomyces aberdarensis]